MVRIVKLTFREEKISEFLELFQAVESIIKDYRGCQSLRLLRDLEKSNVMFTFSEWQNERDLEDYRTSDTFQLVWQTISPWFSQRAEAWSTVPYITDNTIVG